MATFRTTSQSTKARQWENATKQPDGSFPEYGKGWGGWLLMKLQIISILAFSALLQMFSAFSLLTLAASDLSCGTLPHGSRRAGHRRFQKRRTRECWSW